MYKMFNIFDKNVIGFEQSLIGRFHWVLNLSGENLKSCKLHLSGRINRQMEDPFLSYWKAKIIKNYPGA